MWRKNEKRKDSVIAYKKVSEKVTGAVPVMTTNLKQNDMSTTFGVKIPSSGDTIAVARRVGKGNGELMLFFTNHLAELLPDDTELVALDNSNQGINTIGDFKRKMNNINKYPFKEGEAYYTIDGSEIIESIWDCQSEELHDKNPERKYYETVTDAIDVLYHLGTCPITLRLL